MYTNWSAMTLSCSWRAMVVIVWWVLWWSASLQCVAACAIAWYMATTTTSIQLHTIYFFAKSITMLHLQQLKIPTTARTQQQQQASDTPSMADVVNTYHNNDVKCRQLLRSGSERFWFRGILIPSCCTCIINCITLLREVIVSQRSEAVSCWCIVPSPVGCRLHRLHCYSCSSHMILSLESVDIDIL